MQLPAALARPTRPGAHSYCDVPPGPTVRRMKYGLFEVIGLRDLSPEFPSRPAAERWLADRLAELPAHQRPRPRACLSCGTGFQSDGAHHRLCDGCRGGAA